MEYGKADLPTGYMAGFDKTQLQCIKLRWGI